MTEPFRAQSWWKRPGFGNIVVGLVAVAAGLLSWMYEDAIARALGFRVVWWGVYIFAALELAIGLRRLLRRA